MVMHFDRDEEGVYYAIDLGGTDFRVLRVEIDAGSTTVINQRVETHAISEELMGTSQVLVLLYYIYVCKMCIWYISLRINSTAGFIQLCCLDTQKFC